MAGLTAEIKVRLEAELKAELEAAAAEEDRNPSHVARQAIRSYLTLRKAKAARSRRGR